MPIYQKPDEVVEDLEEEVIVDENAPKEEKTWAKRYADLRRLQAKTLAEKKHLEEQLAQGVQLPADPDDEQAIDQWIHSYPQVARIVQGIASREATRANEGLAARVQELNAREIQLKQEEAQRRLADIHPDFFDDIRHRPDFHEWLAEQSVILQDTILGEGYDWKAAASTVTLYKTEKGEVKKPAKAKREPSAAYEVPTRMRTTPSTDRQGYQFTESQIARMSAVEYEKFEDEINDAWRAGKVLRDMTGGAR